ncbi:hypothetical protein M2375_001814 [Comamonas sp. BIGb0152]|nr:hypothetical protein [Comamonas sp. BIGb0152]
MAVSTVGNGLAVRGISLGAASTPQLALAAH